jgi:hypothetical protein
MAQNKQLMKARSSTANPRARKKVGDKTPDGKVYHKCGNRNKIVIHPEDDCYELEKIAEKRPNGWKLSKK